MPPQLLPIVTSACLGALVGLIRQWSDQAAADGTIDLVGVRTYSLWAILGCIAAMLAEPAGPLLLVAVVAMVGVHQVVTTSRMPPTARPGGTTFATTLLTILIGALVFQGHHRAAVLVAALVMVLLGLKQPLHAWTRKFTTDDLRATLQFVAITGVVLPLVPNRSFGPYDAFNPYKTWLLVVLISGLGFVGYVAMRLLGTKAGLLVTSLFGGLASSTATSLAFSRRSCETPALAQSYAMAVVIACSVMLVRVPVEVAVVNRDLALALLPPFALMALPAVAYGLWRWWRREPAPAAGPAPAIRNPLSLKTAVKFAAVYAVIGFLVKAIAAHQRLQSGLLPLSFLSGLTDMDAISLSVANNHASGAVPDRLAMQAVLVAGASNSILKGAFAAVAGCTALRWQVSIVLGLTALAGLAGCWIF